MKTILATGCWFFLLCFSVMAQVPGPQAYNFQRVEHRTVENRIEQLIRVSETIGSSNPECISLPTSTPVASINEFRTRGTNACYRQGREPRGFTGLQPGEHRLMTQDNYPRTGGPLAGVGRGTETGNYLLRRLPDEASKPNFQIVMRVNFQGDPTLTNYMMRRSRECFRDMAPYLRGPDGEQISIQLLDGDAQLSGMPVPAAIPIAVTEQPAVYRGNSRNFGSNFSCATIGHEFFHHLGLCDEYHEVSPGLAADWACRPISGASTYMRNMRSTFNGIVPQTSRCSCDDQCDRIMKAPENIRNLYLSSTGFDEIADESSVWKNTENPNGFCEVTSSRFLPGSLTPDRAFMFDQTNDAVSTFSSYTISAPADGRILFAENKVTCTCPPGHPFCQRIVEGLRQRSEQRIPRSACPVGTMPHAQGPDTGAHPDGSHVEGTGDARVLVVSNPGTPGASLLKPQHFRKMIAGNCTGYATAYDRCAPYAYIPQGPQCASMPPECNSDSYYLNGTLPGTTAQ